MSWEIGAACNLVIAAAYLAIGGAIMVPLARSKQVRANPLGTATAGIFAICAAHRGALAVSMLLPALTQHDAGLAIRAAWNWPLTALDVVGAAVALYYWTLRRGYGPIREGAQLFEDVRRREHQALELNDTVLQGLVVAKMALELGDSERAEAALGSSIDSASRIITQLIGNPHRSSELLRTTPAAVHGSATTPPSTTPLERHTS